MFRLIIISKCISTILPLSSGWIIADMAWCTNYLIGKSILYHSHLLFRIHFSAPFICYRCLEKLADKQNTTIASREKICSEDASKKSNESKSGVNIFCKEDNMPSDNVPAIVGSIVTVIVLLILLGLAMVLFFRLRNKRMTKTQKGNLNTITAWLESIFSHLLHIYFILFVKRSFSS